MDRDLREIECHVSLFNKESRIIKLSYGITHVQCGTNDSIESLKLNLFNDKQMKYVAIQECLHILEEE